MLIFRWRSDGQEASDRVAAAFARYDTAQHRACSAGRDVRRVADAQTTRLKGDQNDIRERVVRQQAEIHAGQTSGVVNLVEGALRSVGPRRGGDRRDEQ